MLWHRPSGFVVRGVRWVCATRGPCTALQYSTFVHHANSGHSLVNVNVGIARRLRASSYRSAIAPKLLSPLLLYPDLLARRQRKYSTSAVCWRRCAFYFDRAICPPAYGSPLPAPTSALVADDLRVVARRWVGSCPARVSASSQRPLGRRSSVAAPTGAGRALDTGTNPAELRRVWGRQLAVRPWPGHTSDSPVVVPSSAAADIRWSLWMFGRSAILPCLTLLGVAFWCAAGPHLGYLPHPGCPSPSVPAPAVDFWCDIPGLLCRCGPRGEFCCGNRDRELARGTRLATAGPPSLGLLAELLGRVISLPALRGRPAGGIARKGLPAGRPWKALPG